MTMNNVDARAKFIRMLMEKVRQDTYPSVTHMELIEQALPAQWIPDYLEILYEKVEEDNYPSVSMLNRIGRLMEAVPA
jgi:hypothetical protein